MENCGPWMTLKVLDGNEKLRVVLWREEEEILFLHVSPLSTKAPGIVFLPLNGQSAQKCESSLSSSGNMGRGCSDTLLAKKNVLVACPRSHCYNNGPGNFQPGCRMFTHVEQN